MKVDIMVLVSHFLIGDEGFSVFHQLIPPPPNLRRDFRKNSYLYTGCPTNHHAGFMHHVLEHPKFIFIYRMSHKASCRVHTPWTGAPKIQDYSRLYKTKLL
jgi:hypothetical protein